VVRKCSSNARDARLQGCGQAEFTEVGDFLDQELFAPRPQSSAVQISEPAFSTPLLQHSILHSLSFDIYRTTYKNVSSDKLFSSVITGIVRRTVGGAGGFEERRRGERFKLALPVQLNDGIGTTYDISTSGIFFETEHIFDRRDDPAFSKFQTRDLQLQRARGVGWSSLMVNSASPWS
jgi:hypothetical protein